MDFTNVRSAPQLVVSVRYDVLVLSLRFTVIQLDVRLCTIHYLCSKLLSNSLIQQTTGLEDMPNSDLISSQGEQIFISQMTEAVTCEVVHCNDGTSSQLRQTYSRCFMHTVEVTHVISFGKYLGKSAHCSVSYRESVRRVSDCSPPVDVNVLSLAHQHRLFSSISDV